VHLLEKLGEDEEAAREDAIASPSLFTTKSLYNYLYDPIAQ
jgi:hypothetical protein